MMIEIPKTAQGLATLASEEDIKKENYICGIAADNGACLLTDSRILLVPNVELGFTNPNLHRRIDPDIDIAIDSNYPFVYYKDAKVEVENILTQESVNVLTQQSEHLEAPVLHHGEAYSQSIQIGVWGNESYRTTTMYIHDEDSTTCEIP